jgi:hypothetical protein
MKKIFLSLIFIVCFLSPYGQSISLTFTAVDSTAYVQLDSVIIMNRTQGSETTIYWPDTTVSIEITPGDLLLYVGYPTLYPVGIGQIDQDKGTFQLLQNYPNPVSDQSLISLYIPEKGKVNVAITDLQGRMLLISDRQLDQGTPSVSFPAKAASFPDRKLERTEPHHQDPCHLPV